VATLIVYSVPGGSVACTAVHDAIQIELPPKTDPCESAAHVELSVIGSKPSSVGTE